MFVILPFEVDFYRKYGIEVDYVGNPVAESVRNHVIDKTFIGSIRASGFTKIAALLPGSRRQEVLQALPLMIKIANQYPDVLFLVAGVNNLPEKIYSGCIGIKNMKVIMERAYDILSASDAAIVTSGTATLETGLWKVPQVVIYKANSFISALIAWMVIKVRFISLINLIMDREVVKELIQYNLTLNHLHGEFDKVLNDEEKRKDILNAYCNVAEKLGNTITSDTAASRMISYLKAKD
jgi:lipid-A-disaccharide synthase